MEEELAKVEAIRERLNLIEKQIQEDEKKRKLDKKQIMEAVNQTLRIVQKFKEISSASFLRFAKKTEDFFAEFLVLINNSAETELRSEVLQKILPIVKETGTQYPPLVDAIQASQVIGEMDEIF